MALTKNFKVFVCILAIAGASGAGLWQANKNNYWGMLDKKPTAVVVEEAPVPQPEPQVHLSSPVPQQYSQPEPQADPTPTPHRDNAFNKMKGMDKL